MTPRSLVITFLSLAVVAVAENAENAVLGPAALKAVRPVVVPHAYVVSEHSTYTGGHPLFKPAGEVRLRTGGREHFIVGIPAIHARATTLIAAGDAGDVREQARFGAGPPRAP